ncbi:hypothetical protein M407DRAFT_142366 [Tulasnella calospora MUT 4182]|uniref:Uncharacterized protein n=1 Tax=Tulasnella calospora MUT 4182 TaxID=1051891 RepID=A0A0C3Q7H3_9AGAM|nr:hypothetical protein M407DRAFT_142366 [Tulasnella calospora MUT 4182]
MASSPALVRKTDSKTRGRRRWSWPALTLSSRHSLPHRRGAEYKERNARSLDAIQGPWTMEASGCPMISKFLLHLRLALRKSSRSL